MHFKEQQMLTSRDNDEKVTRQKTATTTNQVSEPEKNQGEQGTKLQRHWK